MSSNAQEFSDKLADQVKTLFNRNWPEIAPILEDDEEIKLTFGATITNRDGEPGTQADKDHRLKVTMAFSIRHTDTIEVALEDPRQPQLPGIDGGEATGELGEIVDASFDVEHEEANAPRQTVNEDGQAAPEKPKRTRAAKATAAPAATTPLGDALKQAANGHELPRVPHRIEAGFSPERARMAWLKSARRFGWPEAAIDLIDDEILKVGDDEDKVLDIIRAHSINPDEITDPAARSEAIADEAEEIAADPVQE